MSIKRDERGARPQASERLVPKSLSRRGLTKTAGGVARSAFLGILIIWITFPFLWAISCSLRPIEKLFTVTPEWLPDPVTLDNYRWALNEPDFMIPLRNSFIVSGSTALVSVLLGALAAYGLARLRYPGKKIIITAMLATQMLPTMLVIIPIFLIYARIGLYNTFSGLILASTAWTLPYSVLLLRSFFSTLSVSLEEQAMVDGCNRLGAFIRITLPLSIAGIVAVSVFVFIWTWGDMLFPLILSKNINTQTAALSLFNMMQSTRGATNYSGLLAAGIIFTLPAVILFIILQRQLVEGLTAGSLKE
jgi:ABC-type glycerol-3-phosphate transport system permease component